MLRHAYSSCLCLALSLALSCAGPTPDEAPFDLSVQWGLTGSSILPSSVSTIRIVTCAIDPETDAEVCTPTNCSVNALTRMTPMEVASCRPLEGTEEFGDDPVLVRRDLPTDTPIRFLLEGVNAEGITTHTGQAGPFVLGTGERRQLNIRMWSVGEASAFAGESIPRFLHTTTWLPDGRLLVAGGFDQISDIACPASFMFPEGTTCFSATATNSALAIEVGTGQIEPLRDTMLAARGGHTATSLPDGRVLIVGGASEALVAFSPIGMVDSGRFQIFMSPVDDADESTAHASFEVFDAFIGHQTDDPDRDGDLTRGAFIGVGGTRTAGATNQPRFMHAAAVTTDRASRVLVAGGMGSTDTPQTWEVFEANKPGGYGFYRAGMGRLTVPRSAPSAIGANGQVWIFGGALAENNAQLADVWEPDDTNNGTLQSASAAGEFPNASEGAAETHPEYSLMRPLVAAVDGGNRPLVLGWYGAQCTPSTETEVFFDGAMPSEICNSPMPPRTRSFTINAESGVTTRTEVRAQAFGSMAYTEDFFLDTSDMAPPFRRRFISLGGIANSTWSSQRSAEVFTGEVSGSGAASKALGTGVNLERGRSFHTSTGVPGLGVVSVGGVEFTARAGLRLVEEVEIFWLGR